jgi:hypothetical protein
LEVFVFLQDATPPTATATATAPAPQSPPLQRLAPIAQKARPLTLTKGGRTENAVVRQQIFLRTTVKPGAVPIVPDGVTVSAIPCAWTIESYLQREICFYSMTGLLACTDTNTEPLRATETGQVNQAPDALCDVIAKPVELAEARVIDALEQIKAQMFDEDYKLIVRPQLAANGAVVTER